MYSKDRESLDYIGLGDLPIARLTVTRIILISLGKWISEYAPFPHTPSRSSFREPVRNAPPRPIKTETLGVGSAICVLILVSLILMDPLPQTSQAPSVELGNREMCEQKLRPFGAVNPRALDPLAIPPPSTGQRQEEGLAPESGRLLAVQRGPLNVATKSQPLQWALRNRRSHVLLVSSPFTPEDFLEVFTRAKGLKRLTWCTLS